MDRLNDVPGGDGDVAVAPVKPDCPSAGQGVQGGFPPAVEFVGALTLADRRRVENLDVMRLQQVLEHAKSLQ